MSDHEKNKKIIKKIAYTGVLAAFIYIGTQLHIPTAIGHVNLGDLVILVAAYILGPFSAIAGCIPVGSPTMATSIRGNMGSTCSTPFLPDTSSSADAR